MPSLNKAMLIGNLVRDPELKTTQTGTHITNFTIATNERIKVNGEYQDKPEYHKIIAIGKTAENCVKYLGKGSCVYVDGKMQTRQWEKDGVKHYFTEVKADFVQFLSGKKHIASSNSSPGDEGGIPF